MMLMTLPDGMFSRALTSSDCQIVVGTNTYTGCQYVFGSSGLWLKSIRISSFGPVVINAQEAFRIRIFVTNPWTSYPFGSSSFKFTIYKDQSTALSEGVETLSEIYSALPGFSPSGISCSGTQQTSLVADQPNNITLSLSFPGNLYLGTDILVVLPKDTYSNLTQVGSTATSAFTVFYK